MGKMRKFPECHMSVCISMTKSYFKHELVNTDGNKIASTAESEHDNECDDTKDSNDNIASCKYHCSYAGISQVQ